MPRYTIAKEFHFSASHQLEHLPDDHPCKRLHGHNYTVEVVLSAVHLDRDGFVLDYNALAPFAFYLDTQIDHRHLNDLFERTTAEDLARHFFAVADDLLDARIVRVRVSETPKTWAEYREA